MYIERGFHFIQIRNLMITKWANRNAHSIIFEFLDITQCHIYICIPGTYTYIYIYTIIYIYVHIFSY